MSKKLRRQILSLIETLETANEVVKRLMDEGKFEESIELLTECQECAIEIGNSVDKVAGNTSITIPTLEEYCELVYQLANIANDKEERNKKSIQIGGQIEKITDALEQDIPDKLEVVFLPYKASMWDSLESIYIAAQEDPNCETYVVPIPYFERKADGVLGEMYCEEKDYPEQITIINWEDYDFENRQPDIAFIHNAYDDRNLVTCVHPRFFSGNIKKYVDKLIYVPYFVLDEEELNTQSRIEEIKHFCFLPGIINADKVCLQSDKVKQIYMNEYKKVWEAAGRSIAEEELERKFDGTGSPKYDKVLRTNGMQPEIPESWKRMITTSEGNRKKIIFYNISVNALLMYEEKLIDKIQSVLSYFRMNKDEFVLLWRPHPLIETTIESMRPQLRNAYKNLVEQYKTDNYGIYDDTADIDRAVVLSDAYYGDFSSVVLLCQKVGRPVMLQNPNIVGNVNYENSILESRATCITKEDNILWVLTAFTATLLKIDLKLGNVLAVYPLPSEKIGSYDFIDMCRINDILYMAPYNADTLISFSIREESFTQWELPITLEESKYTKKFRRILNRNNVLYLVGERINAIIKFDLQANVMQRIDGFSDNGEVLAKDSILFDNILYVPLLEKSIIMKFDTKDEVWEKINIHSGSDNGFEAIAKNGRKIILTDKKGNITFYDIDSQKIETSRLKVNNKDILQYRKIICYKGKEFYFPNKNSEIQVKDDEGNIKILTYSYPKWNGGNNDNGSKFQMIQEIGNRILFQVIGTGDIFEIDMETEQVRKFNVNLSEPLRKKMEEFAFCSNQRNRLERDGIYTLEAYCRYIKRRHQDNVGFGNMGYGEQIYKKMVGDGCDDREC